MVKDLDDLLMEKAPSLFMLLGRSFDAYHLSYEYVHSLGFLGLNNKFG
jgi:hypothetical protein